MRQALRQALFDLEHSDVYHYSSVVRENVRDNELWVEAMEAKYHGKGKPYGRKEFDSLLGHCMVGTHPSQLRNRLIPGKAVTDTPCIMFYKELIEAYPEAKVILTVRDSPEVWHASFLETIQPFCDFLHPNRPATSMYEHLFRYFKPTAPFYAMNHILARNFMYPDMRNIGPIFYQGYIDEIKRIVPSERLLVFNVKEGWDPLCHFIGKDNPDWDFPVTNERKIIQANIKGLMAMVNSQTHKRILRAAGTLVAVVVACSAALYLQLTKL